MFACHVRLLEQVVRYETTNAALYDGSDEEAQIMREVMEDSDEYDGGKSTKKNRKAQKSKEERAVAKAAKREQKRLEKEQRLQAARQKRERDAAERREARYAWVLVAVCNCCVSPFPYASPRTLRTGKSKNARLKKRSSPKPPRK